MEKAAYTKEQLEAYDKWKINAMTERSALNDAKKEGRAEEAVTIALKMLNDGIAIDIVCKYTGLTGQQVEKLKTEL